MSHPFLTQERPMAFAHRGGALEAEENTAEAFEYAVGLGYSHIETDVHLSRDGVVVVHHDDNFERMFNDRRAIANMDWQDIAALRTKNGASVPRLDEVLASFPATYFNLECKSRDAAGPMAEVVRRADALPRVCTGAFNPKNTAIARQQLGRELCWSPSHGGVARLWAAGWQLPVGRLPFGVVQVPLHFAGITVVTARFVRAAHARGVKVQVWTVNDEREMVRLLDLGVDGLMTDRPSVLKRILQARGVWS